MASWVIRHKATKRVVCETWNPAIRRGLTADYEAVPIRDYLAEVNRAASAAKPAPKEPVEA